MEIVVTISLNVIIVINRIQCTHFSHSSDNHSTIIVQRTPLGRRTLVSIPDAKLRMLQHYCQKILRECEKTKKRLFSGVLLSSFEMEKDVRQNCDNIIMEFQLPLKTWPYFINKHLSIFQKAFCRFFSDKFLVLFRRIL